jgi:DnaJ-class molecular chaperone
VLSPQTAILIPGLGFYKEEGKFGNMIVRFNVHFPETLSGEKKERISAILKKYDHI